MNQAAQNNPKIDARERFLRAYSNLPLNARREIIVVLDEEGPVTWEAAYLEVKNDSEKAKEILGKLEKLNLI
ncbi:MAG TPA: hypothetical protein VJK01_03410 [Candidatus Paceibacterota bacterium]